MNRTVPDMIETVAEQAEEHGLSVTIPGKAAAEDIVNPLLNQEIDEFRRHGFKVGDTGLLMPADMVSEVGVDLPVSPMPNSPQWLTGLVNLRGNIVPLIDLAVLFNIYKSPGADQRQLFFRVDNDWIGIVSSGLPRLLSLPPEHKLENLPAMPWELRPYINGCYRKDGTWFDCDLKSIFSWVRTYVGA